MLPKLMDYYQPTITKPLLANKRMKGILKDQRLTLLWALFILIMCNAKFGSMGHSSLFFPGFDKLVHCGFFFVFVVLCTNGYIRRQKIERLSYKQAFAITLIAIMYGVFIWLVMNFLIVPHSKASPIPFTWSAGLTNCLILIICIGYPLTYLFRKNKAGI